MKAAEVHAMNDHDLIEAIRSARAEQFNLRFRHTTGELENTSVLSGAKRDVARLLTVAHQRDIDIERELRS